jgi:glycosyltransferase involved in cell wall biosynthesis
MAVHTLKATLPGFDGIMDRAGFGAPDLLFMEPGAPLLALLDAWPRARSVYRMCDDTGGFPDAPRTFPAIEAEVCRRVDLVVATAGSLVERARSLGARRVLSLPNACDPEPFAAPGLAAPAELQALPRPRAIYAGAIDSWFDADLVAETARRLPGWSFVLVGPRREPLAALEGIANVHLPGPRPYPELPAWFAGADAAIVPFRLTPMTHAIHPIKVYEYLAAGLPVISTPMRETAAMAAPITLAEGYDGFARALEATVAPAGDRSRGGDEAARAERRAFARANTWDDRFARLARAIDELTPRASEPAHATTGGVSAATSRRAAGGTR